MSGRKTPASEVGGLQLKIVSPTIRKMEDEPFSP